MVGFVIGNERTEAFGLSAVAQLYFTRTEEGALALALGIRDEPHDRAVTIGNAPNAVDGGSFDPSQRVLHLDGARCAHAVPRAIDDAATREVQNTSNATDDDGEVDDPSNDDPDGAPHVGCQAIGSTRRRVTGLDHPSCKNAATPSAVRPNVVAASTPRDVT